MFYEWNLNQQHENDFVMVDSNYAEVAGLGAGFTLQLRKVGGVFAASAGTKAEIGNGWYRYTNTVAEADTPGPVAIIVTGAGAIQQNLLAVVGDLQPNAVEYTYIVTNSVTLLPETGVTVWVTTDAAGANIVLSGLITDAAGIAKDINDNLPRLDPGSYYFWKFKSGFIDDQNPDLEVVS